MSAESKRPRQPAEAPSKRTALKTRTHRPTTKRAPTISAKKSNICDRFVPRSRRKRTTSAAAVNRADWSALSISYHPADQKAAPLRQSAPESGNLCSASRRNHTIRLPITSLSPKYGQIASPIREHEHEYHRHERQSPQGRLRRTSDYRKSISGPLASTPSAVAYGRHFARGDQLVCVGGRAGVAIARLYKSPGVMPAGTESADS